VSVCERTVRVVVVCSLKADKAIRYLLEVDQGTREQASAESFKSERAFASSAESWLEIRLEPRRCMRCCDV
jgi:hypothetical protein